jgi:hypothetical protein
MQPDVVSSRAEPAELFGSEPVQRLEAELSAALRRKPAQEVRLAGALRALCPYSAQLQHAALAALETLVKRRSFSRPLYAALVRSLSELDEPRVTAPLRAALADDDAGGLSTLSAASFSGADGLNDVLAKVAVSRHAHLAFAAEVARAARGESDGSRIASVVPKIKESHRIALCVEVFVPLLRRNALPITLAPALEVLRESERHLGRWLVLAEIAVRAGDARPLEEARERVREGPSSARAAWNMVIWALTGGVDGEAVRPNVELVARLSDRPSADRDTTFLFRLADAKVTSARNMLENLVKAPGLADAIAIRAALYLARDHARADLIFALRDLCCNPRQEAMRGLAAAALFDIGEVGLADELSVPLQASKQLMTLAWASLVRVATERRLSTTHVVAETTFRRIQWGWLE